MIELPKLKPVQSTEDFIKFRAGDDRNGNKVLPANERKKILLLSDDIRFFSGVATQSKEIVMGTLHRYNWTQIGAALKHPEQNKKIILNDSAQKETGVEDAYLNIYCTNGYGNRDIILEVINYENPDMIFHFTDPRQWGWLYMMEYELRSKGIPIIYYNIWDDAPSPMWNKSAYKTCDLLMGISKQTFGLNKDVLRDEQFRVIEHK